MHQINYFCQSIFDPSLHYAQQKLVRDTSAGSKAKQLEKIDYFYCYHVNAF